MVWTLRLDCLWMWQHWSTSMISSHCGSTALTLQQHMKMTSTAVAMLNAGNYWLPDCHVLFLYRRCSEAEKPQTPQQLLKVTMEYGNDVFPNRHTALPIMLTVSVSVASWEHLFSKLMLVRRTCVQRSRKTDSLTSHFCRLRETSSILLTTTWS